MKSSLKNKMTTQEHLAANKVLTEILAAWPVELLKEDDA